ncbi:MAG: tyrosine-type recombinase/integrase [Nitrosopumilaceae archaeon]
MSKQIVKTLRKTLSREEFTNRAFQKSKSIGSKAVVESSLINFEEFCKNEYGQEQEKLLFQLKENQGDELYHFLQDFINFMSEKGLKSATIRAYFSFIRSYFRSQGIKVHSEDVKDLITFPVQVKEMLEPLSTEQVRILLDNSKPDRKALYLTLTSSGMRVSEALSLRKKDFDFSQDPVVLRIQGIHTKTKQTRETFCSSEAKEIVLRLVKGKDENDLVFGKSEDYKKALSVEDRVFANLRKRCNLDEKYEDTTRHKVTIHSMRAFFHTQASLIHGEQYAHALDGHRGYLMQYYRLSREKRAEMYKELEPHLLIYGDPVLKKTYEKLEKENLFFKAELTRQSQAIDYLLSKEH